MLLNIDKLTHLIRKNSFKSYCILNTSISNDEADHEDMLCNHKAAAYFDPWKYKIERLSKGDIVYLFQTCVGLVAMGKADGKLTKAPYHGNPNHPDEEYSMSLLEFHKIDPPVIETEIKKITETDHVFMQTIIFLHSNEGKKILKFMTENGRIKD